jgi:toxin-antitoxin system PIN domain toxin
MPEFGNNLTALVDLNVWLALAFDGHVHHRAAISWFEHGGRESAAFCRITQLGFLRLLTNRTVMGRFASNQRDAWKCYEKLLLDDRVIFLNEPSSLEPVWRRFTHSSKAEPGTWTDCLPRGFRDCFSNVIRHFRSRIQPLCSTQIDSIE